MLAQSYREAQRKITQQGRENAELRAQVEAYEAAAFEQPQVPQFDEAPFEQYDEQPNGQPPVDAAMLTTIAERAAQAAAHRLLGVPGTQVPLNGNHAAPSHADLLAYEVEQAMQARHPDYAEHRGRVVDLLAELPQLVPADLDRSEIVSGLETALGIARKEAWLAAAGSQNTRLQKMQAQTMSGGGGRPAPPSDDDEWWERVQTEHRKGYAQRRAEQ